jgi:hypothetical protein
MGEGEEVAYITRSALNFYVLRVVLCITDQADSLESPL